MSLALLLLRLARIRRLGLSLGLTGSRHRGTTRLPLLPLLEDHVAGGGRQGEEGLPGPRRSKYDAKGGAANSCGADRCVDRERGPLPVLELLHVADELAPVQAQARDGRRRLLLEFRHLDGRAEGVLQKLLEDKLGIGSKPRRGAIGENQHDRGVGVCDDLGRLRNLHVHRECGHLTVDRHLHPAFDLGDEDDAGGQPRRRTLSLRLRGRKRHERAGEKRREETGKRKFHGRVGCCSRWRRRSPSENDGSRRKQNSTAACAASRPAGRRARCAP